MKRIMLFCALLALGALLGGCITINLGQPSPTAPASEREAERAAGDEDVAEAGSLLLYDDEDYDGEDYDFDVPRTLEPATDADQVGPVRVDYVIRDELFATQMDELSYFADEYIGKVFSVIGYVELGEEGEQTHFSVLRDYKAPAHEHGEGEETELYDGEIYPVGIDCYYEGDLPADGAWVRVIGTLADYDYIDEDGTAYPALMLGVASVEEIPQAEGGLRLVTQ